MTKKEFIKQQWEDLGFDWSEIGNNIKDQEIVLGSHKEAVLLKGFKDNYSNGKVVGYYISGWGYVIRIIDLLAKICNNGWIKIESENDLPKEDILCWLIDEEFGMDTGRYDKKENKWYCEKDIEQYITHYKPITKPKPPIY